MRDENVSEVATVLGRSLDVLPWLILLGVGAGLVAGFVEGPVAALMMLIGPAVVATLFGLLTS